MERTRWYGTSIVQMMERVFERYIGTNFDDFYGLRLKNGEYAIALPNTKIQFRVQI